MGIKALFENATVMSNDYRLNHPPDNQVLQGS
jgi:hypothetical protein